MTVFNQITITQKDKEKKTAENQIENINISINNAVVFDDKYKTKSEGDILVIEKDTENNHNKISNLELTKGQIIVGDDSGTPKILDKGTDGYVLKADDNLGVTWAESTGGGGGGGGEGNGLVSNSSLNIPENLVETLTVNKEVFYFNVTNTTTTNIYTIKINASTNVRLVHFVFDTAGAKLKLDFRVETIDKLMVGSGSSRYLTFSSSGQAASLVYIGAKWRVLNTGATVS